MGSKETGACLIGLDLGTTATKGVLMSDSGTILSREKGGTAYERGPGGTVEFDADEQYGRVAAILRRLVAALPQGAAVAAVGMASASGNTLLVDRDGRPLMPAMSWLDTRVTDEMQQVFGDLDATDVHETVGWPLIRMFPLAHLSWLRCHRPDLLDRAGTVCMTTDYINRRLTGKWGIDPSTATTFYLQDQVRTEWHRPYLQHLGIPIEKLPPIAASGTPLGGITAEASAETGLPVGTPVVLGAFDHPCAARGCGVLDVGQMLLSCGTSWVGFYPVMDRKSALAQQLLVDPFLRPNGPWAAMFSLPSIGEAVDRLVRRHLSDAPDRYRLFDGLAAASSPGAGGLLVDPLVEDRILQADRYTQADLARAIMEGTCHLFKRKMDDLRKAGFPTGSVTMVGGPSETFPWPQILSDILGMELSVINGSCAGAAGAAILAGIGAGLYSDEKDAAARCGFTATVRKPDLAAHRIHESRHEEFIAHSERSRNPR